MGDGTRATGRAGRLFLWNDVLPERADEYERWHTHEHVPERVWVPGFEAGTRHLHDDESAPRCLTIFDLSDLSALEGPQYRDLVEHPTPWSVSMRLAIRNFLRKPGRLVGRAGHVLGCALSATRLVWLNGPPAVGEPWPRLAADLLADGAAQMVTRVTICEVVEAGPQAFRNADGAPAGQEYIVVLETADVSRTGRLGELVVDRLGRMKAAAHWRQETRYRLVCRVSHGDVASPARPAPRADLMSLSPSPRPQQR